MTKPVKILSIDGGGAKGIIPAMVLEYIEEQTGKQAYELFDIICGVSTGGFLAAGLAYPEGPMPAKKIKDLYITHLPDIFKVSFWKRITSVGGYFDEKYNDRNLSNLLDVLCKNYKLSEITSTKFLSLAYDIEASRPFLFRSWKARGENLKPQKRETIENQDFYLRDVLRATSACPTYFEPARVNNMGGDVSYYLDGAIIANNPTRMALTQAQKLYPDRTNYIVVSLGCGEEDHSVIYEKAKNWGKAQWVQPLIGIFMGGQHQLTHYELDEEFSDQEYYRFEPSLKGIPTSESQLSFDVKPQTLERMAKRTRLYIIDNKKRLDEVCTLLLKNEA